MLSLLGDPLPELNMTHPFPFSREGMSEKVRCHDWAATPLGPIHSWPAVLRIAVDMLLASRFPGCLAWGDERITLYNDAFEPLLAGKPPALGVPMHIVWNEVWDDIEPIMTRAFQGEATFIEDFPLVIQRNGRAEQAYFTFCYSPVRDEHGTIVGMLDTVIETTATLQARDKAEQAAEGFEREAMARTVERNRFWDLSSDIMLVASRRLEITAINPAWSRVLGWSAEDLVGHHAIDLIHPDDHEAVAVAMVPLYRGERLHDMTCRLRHRDGSYRWIAWAAVPAEDSFHSVGRDVTEERERALMLQQVEEQLRHSLKMEAVGQLTGGLAHDFNNLLTGISASLELLRQRVEQGRIGELKRYIDAAQGASARAATLTHRLLAFSRRQTLAPRAVEPKALIADLEDLVRQTLGPSIEFSAQGDDDVWWVRVDANQLESALLNLCINARDAMPGGGSLWLRARNHHQFARARTENDLQPGQYVCLSVTDSGTGMDPQTIARVFDPFFTTKPLGQGTGLGLSMVYGFVRQSGGQIRVDSSLGQGTAMHLFLPRHTGEIGATLPVLTGALIDTEATGETIVLIDDEGTLRQMVGEALREKGYRVLEAANGVEGLSLVQGGLKADLLITDIGLPGGLDGRQVADAAWAMEPGLKVLFITGYVDQTAAMDELPEAVAHVLTKPFSLDHLIHTVRSMLVRR
ncbi:hybrid sensor histidine kinase/response regulator [Pseudomonas sp. CFBP 13710]|uniref:hybrid sensor histidine kinase/response regulator n=1 Tax=Pseudomonas sp. CFBP 13710 TaxID=2775311 RepID=UPI001FD2DB95|nr:PAS domain-containing sensor histidine kinase [Pseudomonas sp. CFBP 13710]